MARGRSPRSTSPSDDRRSARNDDPTLLDDTILTPFSAQMHWRLLLENVHIEGLIYGNVTAEGALKLCRGVRQMMGVCTLKATDRQLPQCLKLLPDYQMIW